MWTPEIEAAIGEWRRTGMFPFPSLGIYPAPMPHMFSLEDLRLIYHVASLFYQLQAFGANNFTLWTRHIPTYVFLPPFQEATAPIPCFSLVTMSSWPQAAAAQW